MLIFRCILTSSLPLAIKSFSSTAVLLVVSDALTMTARASTKKGHILNDKLGSLRAFPKVITNDCNSLVHLDSFSGWTIP